MMIIKKKIVSIAPFFFSCQDMVCDLVNMCSLSRFQYANVKKSLNPTTVHQVKKKGSRAVQQKKAATFYYSVSVDLLHARRCKGRDRFRSFDLFIRTEKKNEVSHTKTNDNIV